MPSIAGLRQTVAALAFRFCIWRSDAALRRVEVWEDWAGAVSTFGEDL